MSSRTQPRRRMSSEERRAQLLQVTTQLVVEQGFHRISIEAVARRGGVTRALVYQHFEDLEALLRAVIEQEMVRALAQVSETTPTDLSQGDAEQLMLQSLHAFLCAVRDHPATWRLVLMPPEGAPEILRTSIAHGRASVLAKLTSAVRPVVDSERESGDAELTARVLSAISDEYGRLVLTDPARFPPSRLVRHAQWWLRHSLP